LKKCIATGLPDSVNYILKIWGCWYVNVTVQLPGRGSLRNNLMKIAS
jgi:hypothetical protein